MDTGILWLQANSKTSVNILYGQDEEVLSGYDIDKV